MSKIRLVKSYRYNDRIIPVSYRIDSRQTEYKIHSMEFEYEQGHGYKCRMHGDKYAYCGYWVYGSTPLEAFRKQVLQMCTNDPYPTTLEFLKVVEIEVEYLTEYYILKNRKFHKRTL